MQELMKKKNQFENKTITNLLFSVSVRSQVSNFQTSFSVIGLS
jgi:hypothetical protein